MLRGLHQPRNTTARKTAALCDPKGRQRYFCLEHMRQGQTIVNVLVVQSLANWMQADRPMGIRQNDVIATYCKVIGTLTDNYIHTVKLFVTSGSHRCSNPARFRDMSSWLRWSVLQKGAAGFRVQRAGGTRGAMCNFAGLPTPHVWTSTASWRQFCAFKQWPAS